MRYTATAIGATLSTAALLLTAGATANAAPASPESLYAPSALVLAVGHGDDAATAGVDRAVTLSCAPTPSGSHPDSTAACSELMAVDGQFGLIGSTPTTPCTRQWDPITVTAAGVWQGQRVSWTTTYGNACEMRARLADSAVFSF
ncbi:subtilase-type protease inhibitor [Streptomyces sp. NPDC127084]|uniref:subtilase-type protease inhibitor n=1 Tax=Streptomyces sp. NPDC127084 TaxID=3347133 RepID=UPI003650517F